MAQLGRPHPNQRLLCVLANTAGFEGLWLCQLGLGGICCCEPVFFSGDVI